MDGQLNLANRGIIRELREVDVSQEENARATSRNYPGAE